MSLQASRERCHREQGFRSVRSARCYRCHRLVLEVADDYWLHHRRLRVCSACDGGEED